MMVSEITLSAEETVDECLLNIMRMVGTCRANLKVEMDCVSGSSSAISNSWGVFL